MLLSVGSISGEAAKVARVGGGLFRDAFLPPPRGRWAPYVLSGRADMCAVVPVCGLNWPAVYLLWESLGVSLPSVVVESCVSLSRLRILCIVNVSFLSGTNLHMFFSYSKAYAFLLLHCFSQSRSSTFRCTVLPFF